MQANQKHYRSRVRSDDEGDLPNLVEFSIDEGTARNIVFWSQLIRREDLHKIERFDYRATYRKGSDETEDDDEQSEEDGNIVSTDCDCLNVTGTEFWFSAYLKNDNLEVLSERQNIAELAAFFGLSTEAEWKEEVSAPAPVFQAAVEHVQSLASMYIWGYDRNNGERYTECAEPDDGYLDSHNALMGMIEGARAALAVIKAGQVLVPRVAVVGTQAERNIFAEILEAKFVTVCLGDVERTVSCIRHGVLAEAILLDLPPDTLITAEKFYGYSVFGEALVWLSPHFEFSTWQGRPVSEALAAYPQSSSNGPNNALSFPADKPNPSGVSESYITLAQLRDAEPDGETKWCLPNGLVLKITPMAVAIQS